MNYIAEFKSLKNFEKAKVIKFVLIVICYGLQCVQYTGVPVIFYRPKKIINPDPNGPPLFDNEFPNIYSIPMEYDLYGDDEIWEVYMLTAGYIAKYIAYAILILYPIKKSQSHKFFFAPILIIGVSLTLLQIYSSPLMLVFSFFFYFGASSYFFGQVFSYVPSHFTGKIVDNHVIFLNTFWSIIMLLHIFYESIFGGWRENLIYFAGFLYLSIGIIFIYLQKYIDTNENMYQRQIQEVSNQQSQINKFEQSQQQIGNTSNDQNQSQTVNSNQENQANHNKQELNEKQKQQQKEDQENEESSFQMLKKLYSEIYQNKDIRNNIMIWGLCWSACGVSYIGCVLALNRLKGNIFFNMFISTLFELAGNIISIYCIKNFRIKNIIVNNLYIIGISYVSFLFFNTGSFKNNEEDTLLDIIISIFPVIVAKATHETMWNLLLEVQKQIMDIKYHQFSFSFGNVFDIIIHSSLPYYQYTMEKIGFNQFIGYGFYSLLAGFCSSKFKILPEYEEQESKKDLAKEIEKNINEDVELQTLTKQLIEKI
ncbi:transmembrane protein, putative (macronuclear) [Tetrahymena thermophila SB210]|uniref:Transmembrane protein, putative n=1 Tax=Tetrahymena thermophila (strain SB210) TaxID=312017 RepID=Q234P8_TETTS|nr:transmembrane protein, putative [Tetrahymena thermophila SB210]EAR91955.1 transmembrane protein, putative [Tetrahymena thermophila SB210]|eukprot:XP_001012200.1 transmembrane protein, putative [Tetrahymena thermophila SB210]